MSYGHLSKKGSSLLVQQCLGLPLDEAHQLSDWEQRLLLEKQIVYASKTIYKTLLIGLAKVNTRGGSRIFFTLGKFLKSTKQGVDDYKHPLHSLLGKFQSKWTFAGLISEQIPKWFLKMTNLHSKSGKF